MYHVMTTNSMYRILFFLLITGYFFLSPRLSQAGTLQDEMRSRIKEKGWTIEKEYVASPADIEQFEIKYTVSIDSIFNFFIKTNDDNQDKIQINYVLCHTDQDAIYLLPQMISIVGRKNIILRNKNISIEIIATNKTLMKEVVTMMNVSGLQKRKLNCSTVPEDWKLIREISMTQSELQEFSGKVGVQVDEIINQFFLINRERVQVNYISCRSESDAEKVYGKLQEMTGKVNSILQRDTIVMEIISTTKASKDEILHKLMTI